MESLINQTYPDIEIYIRDDGSTDGTVTIAKSYASQQRNIDIFQEDNIGVFNSFFSLLEKPASDNVAYFAFCDQDDIWKPDKIKRAVEMIESNDDHGIKPILYCSRYTLFFPIAKEMVDGPINRIRPSLRNALVQNIAPGCTMVINKKARNLLLLKKPQDASLHDAWFYLVIAAFGTVIYDRYPSLYYRQHENNTVGVTVSLKKKMQKGIQRFYRGEGLTLMSVKVKKFYELFKDDLNEEQNTIIKGFLSLKFMDRLRFVVGKNSFYRNSFVDNIIFKFLYLLKKI